MKTIFNMKWKGGRILCWCLALVVVSLGVNFGRAEGGQTTPGLTNSTSGSDRPRAESNRRLNSSELESLVAPVALYPDLLLGSVLTAARHPGEIEQAVQFLKSRDNGAVTNRLPEAAKSWDPSVVALVRVPGVLRWMGEHAQWTERLAQAVSAQRAEVYSAINRMKQQVQRTTWPAPNQRRPQVQQPDPARIGPTNQVIHPPVYERIWPVPVYQPYVFYYGIPYYVRQGPRPLVHYRRASPVCWPTGNGWRPRCPPASAPPPAPAPAPAMRAGAPSPVFGSAAVSGGILRSGAGAGGTLSYGAGAGGTLRVGAGSGGTFR